MDDNKFMRRAIELALQAEAEGNLPVGAVISLNNKIVAEGRNSIWAPTFDATRHAEMQAVRSVPKDLWKSVDAMSLYTTLEPCLMCFGSILLHKSLMCFGSILLHKIGRVVFGAADDYGGASSVFSCLPPFFQDQVKDLQWVGPLMSEECDPLHERLLGLENGRNSS